MTSVRYNRMIILGLAAAFLAVSPLRAAEPKDLLKHVPDDAWGFVMIRSLENTDKKASILRSKFGLSQQQLPAVTPLVLSALKLEGHLDPASPLCAFALDMQKFGQQATVAIVPVKDSKGALEKLSAGEPQDGVYEVKVAGQKAYLAVKDDVLLAGPSQDCVIKVLKSKKGQEGNLSESRANALGKSDVFVSLAPSAILGAYKDMVMGMLPMIMGAAGGGGDTKSIELLVDMVMQMASFDIAVELSDQGARLSFLVCGVKDSDFDKMIGEGKNTSEPLLAQLPGEKFLVALGGIENDNKYAKKFSQDDWLTSIAKELPADDVDEDALKDIQKHLNALGSSITRYSAAISSLPGGAGGMFGLTVILEGKSGQEMVDAIRATYKAVWKITEDEDFQGMKKVFVHAADAETLDGNKVDTLKIDLKALGEDMDEEDAEKVAKLMGKELALRFGAVGSKHMVLTFGGGQDRFKAVCKAIGSGGSSIAKDAGIVAVSANLPAPRSSECFFSVDAIVSAIKAAAKALGEDDDIPFDLPAINAPIAISGCVQGNAARADVFVPMKLATTIKESIDKQMKSRGADFDDEEEGAGAKKPAAKPSADDDEDDPR